MGDSRYKRCRGCGRFSGEVGTLSWTRQCEDCAATRFVDNLNGMLTMSGPYALHWRKQMAASVGIQLLDEPSHVVQGDGHGC